MTIQRGNPYPRTKVGFFDFSHCRLLPLEYRLPARFETIPCRPISQALTNTSPPSATKASLNRMQSTPATSGDSAALRSSIGCWRKSSPLRLRRSNATRHARADPAFVRKAAKSASLHRHSRAGEIPQSRPVPTRMRLCKFGTPAAHIGLWSPEPDSDCPNVRHQRIRTFRIAGVDIGCSLQTAAVEL
jgi:hypothetical protein